MTDSIMWKNPETFLFLKQRCFWFMASWRKPVVHCFYFVLRLPKFTFPLFLQCIVYFRQTMDETFFHFFPLTFSKSRHLCRSAPELRLANLRNLLLVISRFFFIESATSQHHTTYFSLSLSKPLLYQLVYHFLTNQNSRAGGVWNLYWIPLRKRLHCTINSWYWVGGEQSIHAQNMSFSHLWRL